MKKTKKKLSKYQKALLVFALIITILGEMVLIYVTTSLKEYELADVQNYMTSIVSDMKKSVLKGNTKKYFAYSDIKNKYEDNSSFEKGYKELFTNGNVEYKAANEENVYNIYSDDTLLAKVTLEKGEEKHRLGLLAYNPWKVKTIECFNDGGLYNLDFYIASDLDLYINGKKAEEADNIEQAKIKQFEEIYDKVDIPYTNHYKIANLTYKPDIKVKTKDGKEVELKEEKGAYYAENYETTSDLEVAKSKLKYDYDPLEFAKNWSLFLTADLSGPRYGLYTITKNMIEGTTMYKRAYSWATNVDITFTSKHTLDKETFTNTKVSNYTFYNENAFSVEVYLEKHLTLVTGLKKTDVLHDVFYYAYYDGAYRLMAMESKGE